MKDYLVIFPNMILSTCIIITYPAWAEYDKLTGRPLMLIYRQVSNIRRTKSQHLKDSRTDLRLSLPNPLKPDIKSKMKM